MLIRKDRSILKSQRVKTNKKKVLIRHSQYFVYIVKCSTGAFYTGYTHNLKNRIKLHNCGRGAKYLRGKLPVKLVYQKEFKYFKLALNAERAIKRFSRERKEQMILRYSQNTRKNKHKTFSCPGFITMNSKI